MTFAIYWTWTLNTRRTDMAIQRQSLSYYLNLSYPYTVVPDNGSFFIEFPDLPGCMTQVEHESEIFQAAEEIRTLWIEGEYEDGATIPEPAMQSEYSGKFVTRLPKSLHKELATAAKREGMSLNAYVNYLLAERNVAAQVNVRINSIEAQLVRLTEHELGNSESNHVSRSTADHRSKHGLKVVYREAVVA